MKQSIGHFLQTGASQVISGLAVGWLIGLSVSPILQTVLTSLLAVIAGVTSVLAGLSSDKDADGSPPTGKYQINPAPVMFLVLGVAVGASCGVYARTNLWLGADAKTLAQRTGLKEEQINRRIFDLLYPTAVSKAETSEPGAEKPKSDEKKPPSATGGTSLSASAVSGLYGEITASECEQLRSLRGERLLIELQAQPDLRVRAFAKRAIEEKIDPKLITLVVEEVICPKSN